MWSGLVYDFGLVVTICVFTLDGGLPPPFLVSADYVKGVLYCKLMTRCTACLHVNTEIFAGLVLGFVLLYLVVVVMCLLPFLICFNLKLIIRQTWPGLPTLWLLVMKLLLAAMRQVVQMMIQDAWWSAVSLLYYLRLN